MHEPVASPTLDPQEQRPPARGRAHRAASSALSALILLQAVIAGQALFGSATIELHGWMGNGSFALGLVVAGLAVATRRGPAPVLVAGALALALFTQTGLGYVGRSQAFAAAWHVPLGVAIFGLSVANLMLAYGLRVVRPAPAA
ncbi:MAG TPA: hypothetical protein VFO65_02645 [Acidimicrobiales bacterium]|nr:hypothetical protein [Acidimicrobiales bacterium]